VQEAEAGGVATQGLSEGRDSDDEDEIEEQLQRRGVSLVGVLDRP
jgi:hypothetical protein